MKQSKISKSAVSPWSGFPVCTGDVYFSNKKQLNLPQTEAFIPQGNLQNYGDCALANSMANMSHYCGILSFNKQEGTIECLAGTSIGMILDTTLAENLMPPVCPGTAFVSLGGAIASDVHGKNHIHAGCFSDSVLEISLITKPNTEPVTISRTSHPELFRASCGGMGLTGVICSAKIQLMAIEGPFVQQRSVATRNLDETLEVLQQYQKDQYSLAWLDGMAQHSQFGRGVVSAGNHSKQQASAPLPKPGKQLTVPCYLPPQVINRWSLKLLNTMIYRNASRQTRASCLDLRQFLFPLDRIKHWNRVYGRRGLIQYQFVIAEKNAATAIKEIFACIHQYQLYPVLTVLKNMGQANNNYLSFPMAGYTLAMDFKNTSAVHRMLEQLDPIIVKHGGRFYLAKDARLGRAAFEAHYPGLESFRAFRKKNGMDQHFQSSLSRRLRL